MTKEKLLVTTAWLLAACTLLLALEVWLSINSGISTYSLFPLIGLVTFGLMWSHYTIGAIRRYLQLPIDALRPYLQITSYAILIGLLAHPLLFYTQLYFDGLGLPPFNLLEAYPTFISRLAIAAGTTAFLAFLAYELHRYFRRRSWWKYVEYANIIAMLLIFWHGFVLGGELRSAWFQVVWILYAITFVGSVGYSEYQKRRESYERR